MNVKLVEFIYYIASTINGFIVRENSSFDRFSWDDEFIANLLSEFPETISDHLNEEDSSNDQINLRQLKTSSYSKKKLHLWGSLPPVSPTKSKTR